MPGGVGGGDREVFSYPDWGFGGSRTTVINQCPVSPCSGSRTGLELAVDWWSEFSCSQRFIAATDPVHGAALMTTAERLPDRRHGLERRDVSFARCHTTSNTRPHRRKQPAARKQPGPARCPNRRAPPPSRCLRGRAAMRRGPWRPSLWQSCLPAPTRAAGDRCPASSVRRPAPPAQTTWRLAW